MSTHTQVDINPMMSSTGNLHFAILKKKEIMEPMPLDQKKLTLLAKEGITLQAGDSKLAMKKDQVVLGAKNVIIT